MSELIQAHNRTHSGVGIVLVSFGAFDKGDACEVMIFPLLLQLSLNKKAKAENLEMNKNFENMAQERTAQLQKVLLAEDDLVSSNMMTIILKKNGFEVTAVDNGKEAISAWEKEKFDLILMDVNMPYLDGYNATHIIRLKEKDMGFYTPIIAMTAYALKGDREKCLKSGMDDYFSKPINISEVMEIIYKYVTSKSNESHDVGSNKSFTETVFTLMEASGFDKRTSEALLNDFCEQAVRLIRSIKRHVSENNLEEAGLLLHQLKGSAGNVRANEIAKQVIEAEEVMRLADYEMLGELLQGMEGALKTLMESSREGKRDIDQ